MNRPMLLPLLALAACGAEPARNTESRSTPASSASRVDYPARIRAMPQGQRNAVFLRAVRDAGRECQGVTDLAEVTGDGGPATWLARCDDGGRWVVAISPDGDATVTDQAALEGAAKG